ncbi:MAG TPA: SPFH domain-containing protein [Candidatus Choladousia intestinavium]|uniref:SPFH domain-containing protein n=1 Tax=Candidatus Choladousia intestinavium TaxID=2840727 RepID=A0A9D1D7X6_9FIRM|nr:SPFH domain-containing protein [Candidatus Choladousia intestinavium]
MNTKDIDEKLLQAPSGYLYLFLGILLTLACLPAYIIPAVLGASAGVVVFFVILGTVLLMVGIILLCGLHVINPNEALVLSLFGNYYGTLTKEGFYWTNPFASGLNPSVKIPAVTASGNGFSVNSISKKISTKIMTLNNEKQKVNDQQGNPIEIGTIVIWQVTNPTKAVLNVENYKNYLSIQCDAITRNTARCYPYDTGDNDEKSLRGSTQEVADIMKRELQEKADSAGITIQEVRITRLAYAPEIASAMLQRQQAEAVIDARQKIVEGAVSMVDMALQKLSENDIVELDEERKAAMVSNLLVVLCGNKDPQPIVNSGSIY